MAARAAEEKALEKARRAAEDEAYSDEDRQANMALIARLAGRLGG